MSIRLWIADWASGGKIRAVKEDVSLISKDLQGKTPRAIPFVIRGIGVTVAKVKVRKNEGGGLGLESEEWEFIVRGAQVLGWFKEV